MNILTKVYQSLVFTIGVLLICGAPISAYADESKTDVSNIKNIIQNFANQVDEIQEQQKENNYQNQLNSVRESALNYLGVPYVWGGTSPRGFDCSGFVQYVYKEQGIMLPRTTYNQILCGERVSLDSLAIGDLVFFGNHHVGIYIGDGQYVHAPSRGSSVRIQSMNSYCPTSAQRIIVKR